MSISLYTAIEICMSPDDLEITIGREKEGAKFAFSICRGPGHNSKPIITSQPFADRPEDAVQMIKVILESSHKAMEEDFATRLSFLSQHPTDGSEINKSKVLNPELINRILDELRQHGTASTCEMFDPSH